MANNDLVVKFLPQPLRQAAVWFVIPDQFIQKKSTLIALVLQSKSIWTVEEKQSWFNLLKKNKNLMKLKKSMKIKKLK